MDILDLTECTTHKEVCDAISARMSEISFQDLLKEINKDFVYQQDAVKAIYTGLTMNMNVFLSGPGGYGKSSIIKRVLDIYKIPYHTIIGYKDMPVDALLGIPNMDKLLNDSTYEINFNDSIFRKPGVLIGEEFTDILPSTAAVLKDILSENGYRNKDGKIENLVSIMIVAANKSSSEIIDDESKKALYDGRFPIKLDVTWKTFNTNSYFNLLKVVFKNENEEMLFFMSKLFSINHETYNNTITPRTAIDITKTYLSAGVEFIRFFDINLDMIDEIKIKSRIEYSKKQNELTLDNIIDHIKNIKDDTIKLQGILIALVKLNTIVIDENMLTKIETVKKELNSMYDELYKNSSLHSIIKMFSNYDNKMPPTN